MASYYEILYEYFRNVEDGSDFSFKLDPSSTTFPGNRYFSTVRGIEIRNATSFWKLDEDLTSSRRHINSSKDWIIKMTSDEVRSYSYFEDFFTEIILELGKIVENKILKIIKKFHNPLYFPPIIFYLNVEHYIFSRAITIKWNKEDNVFDVPLCPLGGYYGYKLINKNDYYN